ncbi:AAA family ATPase [Cellulomonas sp. APG4]|uniref:replicative DNA helicase n=1 Tax=Cellulomonas sp. APG4 TaxID=1538656 RepID=UPI00137994B5|nr:DnaB-like helicase C-terminal domain-containing protein [Cellulomonas sp. APG4]NCT91993.1 AAA family ATPase [Cellulomonas sp. APG4]
MSERADNQWDRDVLEENERYVLGACMTSAAAIDEVRPILEGLQFRKPQHQAIYDAILAVADRGEKADAVAVASELMRRGLLDPSGGGTYLFTCLETAVVASAAAFKARELVPAARGWALECLGAQLAQAGAAALTATEQDELIASAIDTLLTVQAGFGEDASPAIGNTLEGTLERLDSDEAAGVETGLEPLDDIIGGLAPGKLVIVGAAPGVGKTVIAQAFVRHAAVTCKRPVLSFTLEVDRDEITTRMIADLAEINSRKFTAIRRRSDGDDQKTLCEGDWAKIAKAADRLVDAPWHVNDDTEVTLGKIAAEAARVKRLHGGDLALITIDYAGLIVDMDDTRHDTRAQLAALTRGLKILARRLRVPIVLLSQLNRRYADRPDKRPQKTDLAGSSTFEQDADVILLLHREEVFEPETPRAGEMDVIVAKHRRGQTGTAVVAARMHLYRVTGFNDPTMGHSRALGHAA